MIVKNLRHPGFDYHSVSVYFVTVCAVRRGDVFGHCREGQVTLNTLGGIIDDTLRRTPQQYQGVELDADVVMPDHVHAILVVSLKRPGQDLSAIGTGIQVRQDETHPPTDGNRCTRLAAQLLRPGCPRRP